MQVSGALPHRLARSNFLLCPTMRSSLLYTGCFLIYFCTDAVHLVAAAMDPPSLMSGVAAQSASLPSHVSDDHAHSGCVEVDSSARPKAARDAVAAMVDLLQVESRGQQPRGDHGHSSTEDASSICLQAAVGASKQSDSRDPQRGPGDAALLVAPDAAAGQAVLAELELESLSTKRRRLEQLSIEVLEVRCPGFCQRARLNTDDLLREAGYALATISHDVSHAEDALRMATAAALGSSSC